MGSGDYDAKLERCRHALAISERQSPASLDVAAALKQLGIVLGRHGELAEAQGHLMRALELQERLAPGTRQHASLLNYMANVRRSRGDLAEAERGYRRSLAI